jgi:sugar lactone lactonase YvrE
VIPTEQIANPASTPSRDGLFAALRTLLHGGGTGAPSVRRLAMASLCALTAALALTTTPAQAARGHVFERQFGSKGTEPGQFEGPAGLAVNEATGNIYVVDRGNNRVEFFNPAGELQGQFTGPSATGTGTLTEGSNLIEALATESGAFTAGEEITASGLPAETKIVAVKEGGVLEVSNPVEAGKSKEAVALAARQQFFFKERNAIAVDNSCVVRKLAEPACKAADPSNGDVYVTSGEFGQMVVDKFTAAGVYLGQISQTSEASFFELVQGVAVDPKANLWITEAHEPGLSGFDSFSDVEPNVFNPPFILMQGNRGLEGGLAVDAEGNLYIHIENGSGESPVWKVGPTGTVLNRKLDPESSVPNNGVATEIPSNDVYVDNVSTVKRFAADGALVESFGEAQLAGGSCPGGFCTDGVAVSSASGRVYVSEAVGNVVLAYQLEAPGPPAVRGESVSAVTSESATFAAEVEPRSVPGEPATTYRFEYGPCSSPDPGSCSSSPYGLLTPSGSLAASFDLDQVSAHVSGLLAGRLYHFRVLAENAISKAEGKPGDGPERVFTTEGTGEFVLPDGRAWEMVSPPQKNGALIASLGIEGAMQAAAGGGAVTYVTGSPTEPEPLGSSFTTQVLSARGADGWSSRDVALAHSAVTGVGVGRGQEPRLFSEDLSGAVLQPFGAFDALVSAEASEQSPYLYSDHPGGVPCTSSCFAPMVNAADATAGVPFGEEGLCGDRTGRTICGPEFLGASADLAHVVLKSAVALTAGGGPGLYEWSAGSPAPERLRFLTGAEKLGLEVAATGAVGDAGRNAVSADGSRVFSSARGHLFMTEAFTARTLDVGAPDPACLSEPPCGEGPVGAEFQGASSDGSRVLFADTQKLTADGGSYVEPRNAVHSAADLYECVIVQVAGEPKCQLTDLAPSGLQLGSTLGSSQDGSWVYFVANGVLASGAVAGGCPNSLSEGFERTTCNLYVRHAGVTRLVAVLSGEDAPDWATQLAGLTARVSPDGRWLAFMSQRSLTGYDNRDAVSGRPDEEVYLYDAVAGRLVCASCDPTGARPHGSEYGHGGENLPLSGGHGTWPANAWLAANVPQWQPYEQASAIYQPRYLSGSGRLFFNSVGGLVPKDANGTGDVYQYEPEGVPAGEHACGAPSATGSEVYRPERKTEDSEGRKGTEGPGCVALISSGSSARESAFLDASSSGGDVFFLTSAQLTPQDFDGALDVYDAHECTSQSPCLPVPAAAPPACNTEASCKAAPSSQPEIFGPPASATFSGLGNIAPPPPITKTTNKTVKCKRSFVKNRKGKCVRKPKSKRHRAKRSIHTNRRAG